MKIQKILKAKSKSDKIFNVIVQRCEFYLDQNKEAYLILRDAIGYDQKYLTSPFEVKNFLRNLYYQEANLTAKKSDITNVYETICAIVEESAEIIPVFTRVAHLNGKIFYDLIDDDQKVVKVDETGVSIIDKKGVRDFFFTHDLTMREQVKPCYAGYGVMDFAKEFFNISTDHFLLFVVYICVAFIQDIMHPIFVVEGERGAGKSTVLEMLMAIINPVSKDTFFLSNNTDNLITTLSNNHFSVFDNVGSTTITDEISNVLCKAATGGTLTKRKLFSDNTEIAIHIKRLVALDGINMSITQTDLLDRAIMVMMERIDEKKRKTREDIDSRFKACLPSLLGDIFSILSDALKIYPTLKLSEYPRMADFAKYGYAVAEAIGKGQGDVFISQYKNNARSAIESAISENPFLECIRLIVDEVGEYQKTMSELLIDIKNVLPKFYIGHSLPPDFPKSANVLSRRLNTCGGELKELGIELFIGRKKERYVNLKKIVDTDDTDESLDSHDFVDARGVIDVDEE